MSNCCLTRRVWFVFRKHAIPAAERLQKFTEKFVSWFAEMVLHNILFVQYEDLVDVTKQHALALAMTTITMRYLPVPVPVSGRFQWPARDHLFCADVHLTSF